MFYNVVCNDFVLAIFYDPYSKPYVWPRIDLYMEKVQKSSKYIFDETHSEPHVWPRIEINR